MQASLIKFKMNILTTNCANLVIIPKGVPQTAKISKLESISHNVQDSWNLLGNTCQGLLHVRWSSLIVIVYLLINLKLSFCLIHFMWSFEASRCSTIRSCYIHFLQDLIDLFLVWRSSESQSLKPSIWMFNQVYDIIEELRATMC